MTTYTASQVIDTLTAEGFNASDVQDFLDKITGNDSDFITDAEGEVFTEDTLDLVRASIVATDDAREATE